MSIISFIYNDKDSIYVNTKKDGADIVLAPVALTSKNALDWDFSGAITTEDQEIAVINNQNPTLSQKVSDIVHIDQQTPGGEILFRALVQADDVPGAMGDGWYLYVDIRHHDDTWEYAVRLPIPTGKYPWSQFAFTTKSAAGKTINYVYPSVYLRQRTGKAKVKFLEVMDLSTVELSEVGEAYSKPECIYEPISPVSPQGQLKLDMVAFFYGDLDNIDLQASPSHSIETLKQFPYLVCNEPGTLSVREKYVTDELKTTVKIFGYIAMGAEGTDPLPDMTALKTGVDRIAAEGWYGVFLDRFGYDYKETRARQNEIVDYCHSKNLKAFANAWNIDDVLGSQINPTYNPSGTPTSLALGDWALLEAFLMSNSGYTSDAYTAIEKYTKAKNYKESLGVNICCLSDQRDAATQDEAMEDAKLSYLTAIAFGFDGWWFVDSLSEEKFSYQLDPDLNIGSILTTKFSQISPYWYIAETDAYIIIFSTENYPPLSCVVYNKAKKRLIKSGNKILYSKDLRVWTGNPVGKFVREKRNFGK